jgi:hypothetical protein
MLSLAEIASLLRAQSFTFADREITENMLSITSKTVNSQRDRYIIRIAHSEISRTIEFTIDAYRLAFWNSEQTEIEQFLSGRVFEGMTFSEFSGVLANKYRVLLANRIITIAENMINLENTSRKFNNLGPCTVVITIDGQEITFNVTVVEYEIRLVDSQLNPLNLPDFTGWIATGMSLDNLFAVINTHYSVHIILGLDYGIPLTRQMLNSNAANALATAGQHAITISHNSKQFNFNIIVQNLELEIVGGDIELYYANGIQAGNGMWEISSTIWPFKLNLGSHTGVRITSSMLGIAGGHWMFDDEIEYTIIVNYLSQTTSFKVKAYKVHIVGPHDIEEYLNQNVVERMTMLDVFNLIKDDFTLSLKGETGVVITIESFSANTNFTIELYRGEMYGLHLHYNGFYSIYDFTPRAHEIIIFDQINYVEQSFEVGNGKEIHFELFVPLISVYTFVIESDHGQEFSAELYVNEELVEEFTDSLVIIMQRLKDEDFVLIRIFGSDEYLTGTLLSSPDTFEDFCPESESVKIITIASNSIYLLRISAFQGMMAYNMQPHSLYPGMDVYLVGVFIMENGLEDFENIYDYDAFNEGFFLEDTDYFLIFRAGRPLFFDGTVYDGDVTFTFVMWPV